MFTLGFLLKKSSATVAQMVAAAARRKPCNSTKRGSGMSFVKGFRKVAAHSLANTSLLKTPARLLGMGARAAEDVGKGLQQSVKNLTVGQRTARLEGYRGASKPAIGAVAAQKDIQALKSKKPNMDSSKFEAKSQEISKQKRNAVLARYDKMQQAKKTTGPGFIQRHPFLTAGGVYLGARAMSGGDEGQQAPPPQVVQY